MLGEIAARIKSFLGIGMTKVVGGVPGAVLYEDASGALAASSAFSVSFAGATPNTNTLNFNCGNTTNVGGINLNNMGVGTVGISMSPSNSFYSVNGLSTVNNKQFMFVNGNAFSGTSPAFTFQFTPNPSDVLPFVFTHTVASLSASPLISFQRASSTAAARSCGIIDVTFNTNTDATWTGNLLLYAGDYTSSNAGKRLGVQIQSNGSVALVGLFGATPVIQPQTTGTTTGYTTGSGTAVLADGTFTGNLGSTAYTIGDVVLALKQLGLLKQ